MVQSLRCFLHDLETLGLAESGVTRALPAAVESTPASSGSTLDLLRSIAEHFGYRLA